MYVAYFTSCSRTRTNTYTRTLALPLYYSAEAPTSGTQTLFVIQMCFRDTQRTWETHPYVYIHFLITSNMSTLFIGKHDERGCLGRNYYWSSPNMASKGWGRGEEGCSFAAEKSLKQRVWLCMSVTAPTPVYPRTIVCVANHTNIYINVDHINIYISTCISTCWCISTCIHAQLFVSLIILVDHINIYINLLVYINMYINLLVYINMTLESLWPFCCKIHLMRWM